jgi:small subunit ribosomal protein S2
MAKIVEEIKKDLKKGEKIVEGLLENIEEKIFDKSEEVKKEKLSKDLEEEAKRESLETEEPAKEEKTIAEKKKELLEKVKKLSEKVETTKTEDLKEQVKLKKRADMLIPLEDYVKSGIYIGTKVVTPNMRQFVYRRRADGLAIFNTDLIDEKLKEGIAYLSKFNPEDVILVCKRQAGWKAAEKFSELTGIRVFTKKYPAGVLTNTNLPDFFENELTIVTDSWLDRNALLDTVRTKKKVLMICDTNNFPKGSNQMIIGNNKSAKSLGVMFYLLARGYIKAKKLDTVKDIPDLDWWVEEE